MKKVKLRFDFGLNYDLEEFYRKQLEELLSIKTINEMLSGTSTIVVDHNRDMIVDQLTNYLNLDDDSLEDSEIVSNVIMSYETKLVRLFIREGVSLKEWNGMTIEDMSFHNKYSKMIRECTERLSNLKRYDV
jgi:hypothetical protein